MNAVVDKHHPNDISVVIGFKDWGLERLLLSVESILESFGDLVGEVIVSDYGSKDRSQTKNAVEELGAKYLYTETNGTWSRSRALNAGFAISTGTVLVSTDADMLFSPQAMNIIGQRVLKNPHEALVLQCRDLPRKYDSDGIQRFGKDWENLEQSSTLRPRWGMGGMMAVSRSAYLLIRGFDERMEIYGGEDMDFVQRLRWSGCRISWISEPNVRMYHMWHLPTRTETDKTEQGRDAIIDNRKIVLEDKSIIRNLKSWKHSPKDALPVASVVISTRNRAEYLKESIYSVLSQTVRDIEVIVVDDGSEDNTESVVRGISDPRIRYFKREASGIAAARNFAATVTRSAYTVIHDDDDLMFPDRIENQLKTLGAGMSGTYGGWIDFQDLDASSVVANTGKKFSLAALLFSGKIFAHATLMLETALIKTIGYDERLRSGSDYNLAVRLARSGAHLEHTGHFHLVRRLHGLQVTTVDSSVQKNSARLTSTLGLRNIRPGKQKQLRTQFSDHPSVSVVGGDDPLAFVTPFLPDHLVKRRASLTIVDDSVVPPEFLQRETFSQIKLDNLLQPQESYSASMLNDASWADLAALRRNGIDFDISVAAEANLEDVLCTDVDAPCVRLRQELLVELRSLDVQSCLVLVGPEGEMKGIQETRLSHMRLMLNGDRVDAVAIKAGKFNEQLAESVLEKYDDKGIDVKLYLRGIECGSENYWTTIEALLK